MCACKICPFQICTKKCVCLENTCTRIDPLKYTWRCADSHSSSPVWLVTHFTQWQPAGLKKKVVMKLLVKGEGSPWQFVHFCPTLRGGAHLRFQPSVCPKTIFHGHMASMTRHRTPLPSHHGGTYLSTRSLHAFKLLGWRELGQAMGAHSVAWIRSYGCRSSDLAAQRLLYFYITFILIVVLLFLQSLYIPLSLLISK